MYHSPGGEIRRAALARATSPLAARSRITRQPEVIHLKPSAKWHSADWEWMIGNSGTWILRGAIPEVACFLGALSLHLEPLQ